MKSIPCVPIITKTKHEPIRFLYRQRSQIKAISRVVTIAIKNFILRKLLHSCILFIFCLVERLFSRETITRPVERYITGVGYPYLCHASYATLKSWDIYHLSHDTSWDILFIPRGNFISTEAMKSPLVR